VGEYFLHYPDKNTSCPRFTKSQREVSIVKSGPTKSKLKVFSPSRNNTKFPTKVILFNSQYPGLVKSYSQDAANFMDKKTREQLKSEENEQFMQFITQVKDSYLEQQEKISELEKQVKISVWKAGKAIERTYFKKPENNYINT